MCVQAFRAELAVEGLDEAIVCGLSWPREVQRDVVGIGPEIEIARDKFAAVVNSDRLRVTYFTADPFERLNDIFTSIAEPRIDRRTEAGMCVDNGEDAQLLA